MDTQFPADLLGALGMIPGGAGLDLEEMLRDKLPKQGGKWPEDGCTRLMDITKENQRIEVTIDDGFFGLGSWMFSK